MSIRSELLPNGLLTIVIYAFILSLSFSQLTFAKDAYKLGIVAVKGAETVRKEWQPTADYLSVRTGKKFVLAPLKFSSVIPAVRSGRMDFVLCNPAIFCQIREKHGTRALTSMTDICEGKPLNGFGSVIFTLGDSKIRTLSDLKGKKIAAVQKEALMGYKLQIYVLRKKGMTPGKDFDLFFAGKLPLVVKAVRSGAADVGFIRTGHLEWLEKKGTISVSDFKVIEPESDDFPYRHNGPILPYWIFGAAKSTDAALAKEVAAALKEMKSDSAAAEAANIYGWEDPADLSRVEEVLKSFK